MPIDKKALDNAVKFLNAEHRAVASHAIERYLESTKIEQPDVLCKDEGCDHYGSAHVCIIEKPDSLPPVAEIKPCPYINGFAADNTGVSFIFHRYDSYSDFVLFDNARPARCFRFAKSPEREISADDLLTSTATYLEQNGWKVLVIGSPSIHHDPADLEFNYQFVLKFTGKKTDANS